MVREKTNLVVKDYNPYYCHERGCDWGDIWYCVANGPCSVYGGECPNKKKLTSLSDFNEGLPETKAIFKEKKKKWWFNQW